MYWFFVLLVSLGVVRLIAGPLLRALREKDDGASANVAMRVVALAAICLAPLAAALIYLEVGAPESLSPNFQLAVDETPPDPRAGIAALPDEERAAMIETMVSGLAARLAAEPDDPDGWRMLARSYGILNQPEDSARAYRELIARDENASSEDWRNFALSLLAVSRNDENSVSEEAQAALMRLLSIDENDGLALFYLGMAARERGERDAALEHWRKLISVLPGDAPILAQLQNLIDETAGEGG